MENTDCEKILNLIPLYVDDMLTESEKEEVVRHLKVCANCKKEYTHIFNCIHDNYAYNTSRREESALVYVYYF